MNKQGKTTVKNGLSLDDLRALVDFAIEAYDSGHRPHMYIESFLIDLMGRARSVREQEKLRERRS